MPFSAFPVFKVVGGYDAHYVNVNWGSAPPPPPAPPVPPAPTTTVTLWVQDSKDGGKTWKTLFKNNI
jgi:hypothetical protein